MTRHLWNCRIIVRSLSLALGLSGALSLSSAVAAPVVYGNLSGTNVDYLGIQEDSTSDPGTSLFGAPSITGDGIDFNPSAFGVAASNGSSDAMDSTLEFVIDAKPNRGITSVGFAETGDGSLAGLAGEAISKVAANLSIEILEANIAGILTPVNLPGAATSLLFAPQDEYKLSVEGAGTFIWSGSLDYDLAPILAANSIVGVATKVKVTLENLLTVSSAQGNSAFMQKKDADGLVVSVTTQEIPEPASAALVLLLSTAGLVCRGTRR